jgi:hypothetical protein
VPDIDRTRRLTPFGFEPSDDRQQITHRPRKPIELGTNELVPLANVIECLLKLPTLGHRRHLLAEYLLAAGSAKAHNCRETVSQKSAD